MATRHLLALDVLDTANARILKLSDASVYSELRGQDCPRLEVTAPGRPGPSYVTTHLSPGFVRLLSATDLDLSHAIGGTPPDLPDGLYYLRYSLAPNELVFTEHCHLRTVRAEQAYQRVYATLALGACEPSAFQRSQLRELRDIGGYLLAARAQAETCHSPQKGLELLTYATELLRKFGSCSTC